MTRRHILLFAITIMVSISVHAQRADNYPPNNKNVTIDSTNLPIVWLDVNGAMILKDERITAHMKIIHNGDGQVNITDVTVLISGVLNSDEEGLYMDGADCSGDGELNINDITLLISYILTGSWPDE